MIQISKKVYIDISIGSWKISSITQFLGLTIEEEMGGSIPTFRISLRSQNYDLLAEAKLSKNVVISFGKSPDKMRTYNFQVINFNSEIESNFGLKLNISGILDIKDYYNNPEIKLYQDLKAEDVLNSIGGVTPNIEITTNGKMNWINANGTQKDLAEEVIRHALVPDTYPIFGINLEKKLFVKKASKQISSPKVTFLQKENSSYPQIIYDNLVFDSKGIYANFLSENKKLPVLDIKTRELTYLSADNLALDKKVYNYSSNSKNFPTKIDCYNTHSDYFQAEITNLSKWARLSQMGVYVLNDKYFLTEDELTICDGAKLIINNKQLSGIPGLSGNYIVDKKTYSFSVNKAIVKTKLVRDFFV